MKRSNSTKKALGAFKKLGAVALITATIFFVACKQTGNTGGGGESTPKHAVTFSVEGGNGTLKAKAYGVAETTTSPINVEEGKAVIFTATADAGYRLKGWTLDGNAITEAGTNTEYKLKVSKAVIVKVSFEKIPTHVITFSVDGANGTLKAKADGMVAETATSPITVEEGKTVTFTAEPDAGYRVKEWKVDGDAVNGTNNSYSLKIEKTVNLKVSFDNIPLPTYAITFSVDGANGTLKAKADGVPETATSPITVEEGKTVTFTAEPSANYKVKEWKVGDTVVTGNKTNTYAHTVTKAVIVKVSFEANSNPPTPTPTKYTVTLNKTEHGKVTASPEIPEDKQVAKDTEITFTAQADTGYKIGKWTVTGSALEAGTGADGSSTAKVKITANTTVSVSFEANSNPPNPPTPPNVPSVEGGAVLILSPDKLAIKVKAKTADGSAIQVKGCSETTLASDVETELHAKGTTVILKGKITKLDCHWNNLVALNVQGLTALQELSCGGNKLTSLNVQGCASLQVLYCSYNQLTELNVQGCASLKELGCHRNQLKAQAMTALLNALPAREADDDAKADLYTEETDEPEGNYKDYTQPEGLKKALDGARSRNWRLRKYTASGKWVDI